VELEARNNVNITIQWSVSFYVCFGRGLIHDSRAFLSLHV